MSDLVDRYLAAVAALLPRPSARTSSPSCATWSSTASRRPRRAWVVRWTRPRPRPCCARSATRSPWPAATRPHRALIGPELYPFWLVRVKVMLVIAAFAAVVPAGVLLATGHTDVRAFNGVFGDFVPTALSLIGAATLVGAAIERGWINIGGLANWKASELPRVPEGKTWFAKSRFDGLFELAAIALFIALVDPRPSVSGRPRAWRRQGGDRLQPDLPDPVLADPGPGDRPGGLGPRAGGQAGLECAGRAGAEAGLRPWADWR
ncbi:hypothetical protein ACRAWD_06740 [Caulobacter segnis]